MKAERAIWVGIGALGGFLCFGILGGVGAAFLVALVMK